MHLYWFKEYKVKNKILFFANPIFHFQDSKPGIRRHPNLRGIYKQNSFVHVQLHFIVHVLFFHIFSNAFEKEIHAASIKYG